MVCGVWCVVCGDIDIEHQQLEHAALLHYPLTRRVFFLTNTVFLPLDEDDLSSSPDRIETFPGKDGRGNCFVQFVSSGGFS